MSEKKKKDPSNPLLTPSAGTPVASNANSMTAGLRGKVVFQDYQLFEKIAHQNRERIAERVVHAKGWGAHGTFKVTNDISKYTRAKIFSDPTFQEPPMKISGDVAGYEYQEEMNVYKQPRDLYNLFDKDQKKRLFGNIARVMSGVPEEIINRQLNHFVKVDQSYGDGVRKTFKKNS